MGEYLANDWSFSGDIVKDFDSHIEKSVLNYKTFRNIIRDISVYFSRKNTQIVDIGCSTGTFLKDIYIKNICLNSKTGIEYVGLDIEEDMIEVSSNRYKGLGIKFKKIDALEYCYKNASVITSILTLQFMDNREELLKRIYREMNDGGALFIVEKIKTPVIDIHDIYNDLYYDFKRTSGITDSEIINKNVSLRGIMHPLTLDENIEHLKLAGFTKIDVFMKIRNFVGIIAIK